MAIHIIKNLCLLLGGISMTMSTLSVEKAQQLFNGAKVKTIFETAKGSVYFISENYETIRFKSLHIEHGEADQGWKPIAENVAYVSEEDALYIAGVIRGNCWLTVHAIGHSDVELCLVIRDRKTGTIGKSLEVIDFQGKPGIGLSPIELFNLVEMSPGVYKPNTVHVGNSITRIVQQ